MKMQSYLFTALLLLAAPALLAVEARAQKLPASAVQLMRCPNGGTQPQAEMALDGVLHLVYLKGSPGGSNLEYVRSTDDGKTFSDPVRVNSSPDSVDGRRQSRGGRLFVAENGSVHVAWCGMPRALDGLEKPAAPAMYSRLDSESGAFEPERVLSSGLHGLDAAPGVVQSGERVLVTWQALADDTNNTVHNIDEEKHPSPKVKRTVYLARSEDSGATFAPQDSLKLHRNSWAASGCAVSIGFPRSGEFNIFYRADHWRGKDLRNLASTDDGDTFRSLYMDDWRTKRKLHGNPILALGPRPSSSRPRLLVTAYEREGRVWWLVVENIPEDKNIQLAPRERDVWQGRPNIAASERGVTMLIWMEGEDRTSYDRIGWQGWITRGHGVVGSGKFRDIPKDAVPDVFVSADGLVYHIIY